MADGMQHLPAGWRVVNSSGSYDGPAPPDDDNDNEDMDIEDELEAQGVDIRPDSPGWEDVNAEDDKEVVQIKDFFSSDVFPDAKTMLDHCKQTHGFDLLAVCAQHKLDFLDTMKLVNYLRTQAASGNTKPDTSNPSLWADDKYMQPALEDDALLFSLGDIVDFDEPEASADA